MTIAECSSVVGVPSVYLPIASIKVVNLFISACVDSTSVHHYCPMVLLTDTRS